MTYNLRVFALLFSMCLLLIFFAGLMPNTALAQEDVLPDKIDLSIDKDSNGIPDALENEVNAIGERAVMLRTVDNADEAAVFSVLAGALKDMDSRLPYSSRTRELQGELDLLQQELFVAEDEMTATEIREEIGQIQESMLQDSAYRTVIESLEKMFIDPQTGLSPVEAPMSFSNHIYLPVLIVESHASETSTSAVDEAKESVLESRRGSTIRGINWSRLFRGDIMLVRSGWFPWNALIYCMWYCHTGSYDGNNFVYESNPNPDGVKLKSLNEWKKSGQFIGLAYNRYTSYSQDRAALDWAKGKWKSDGTTKYNYNYPNKDNDSTLYCSQLVWKIHKRNNYDLDSNNWSYLLYIYNIWGYNGFLAAWMSVTPDEIARDGDVYIYSSGWN